MILVVSRKIYNISYAFNLWQKKPLDTNEKIITKSKYTNTENSKQTSKQRYVDVYKLTKLWTSGTFLTKTVVLSELTQKTKIMFLFLNLREQVFFWSTLSYPASMCYFCSEAQPGLFVNVYHCFPTPDTHMTGSNMDMMKGNGGETLMSMLSTSKDIWCTGKAHSYLEREKKMGHCLSATSLTAFSHNNWSAFVDTLILMRPNPLFSPQWIHR